MASGATAETYMDDSRADNYHPHHPMRVEGTMPHDLPGDGWIEFQILEQMTEAGYWLSVERSAIEIEQNGLPLRTEQLTPDQKGWAKMEHYDHYHKETARWRANSGGNKVTPYRGAMRIRDLTYRNHCSCEVPSYKPWGWRWDLKPLHQCHNCGEVIIKPPRIYNDNLHAVEDKEEPTE
jgi:hypothetical protein